MTAAQDFDAQALREHLRRMIPPSAQYAVPGADDPAIFADILATLPRQGLSGAAALTALAAEGAGGQARIAVIAVMLQCYYRDDRVMRSLGMEPRAPFPKGFEVEPGDWSLLEPVRTRPRLWRDAP